MTMFLPKTLNIVGKLLGQGENPASFMWNFTVATKLHKEPNCIDGAIGAQGDCQGTESVPS